MSDKPIESFEIERKYKVPGEATLPDAAAFATLGFTLDDPETNQLRARYFDTPSGDLASQRFAVRKRIGGKDEGWHLKERGDDGAREYMWPLSAVMPDGLRDELVSRVGAESVARVGAIATLRTDRRTTCVRDSQGNAVIELADDRVDATNELADRHQQWREWEAELMPGADPDLLEVIEPLLVAQGAARVRGTSKIQRTMRGA